MRKPAFTGNNRTFSQIGIIYEIHVCLDMNAIYIAKSTSDEKLRS